MPKEGCFINRSLSSVWGSRRRGRILTASTRNKPLTFFQYRGYECFRCTSMSPYAIPTWRLSRQLIFFPLFNSPSGSRPPHWWGFEITLRHTTFGRTPLDEWSARRRDSYLHNTQNSEETTGGIRTRNPRKRAAADVTVDCAVIGNGRVNFTPVF